MIANYGACCGYLCMPYDNLSFFLFVCVLCMSVGSPSLCSVIKTKIRIKNFWSASVWHSRDKYHFPVMFPHSLSVRIWPFQGWEPGSIPGEGSLFNSSYTTTHYVILRLRVKIYNWRIISGTNDVTSFPRSTPNEALVITLCCLFALEYTFFCDKEPPTRTG